jgi:hypothetical protein
MIQCMFLFVVSPPVHTRAAPEHERDYQPRPYFRCALFGITLWYEVVALICVVHIYKFLKQKKFKLMVPFLIAGHMILLSGELA